MSADKNSNGFSLWTSTIMLKVIMAITGLGMAVFVLGHMAGHLQMFLGRDAYNAYAHFLQHGMGELIWIARLGLIALVVGHTAAAVRLIQMNAAARPRDYSAGLQSQRTTAAAKYMRVSGVTIGAFILFHLIHFTLKQGMGLVDQDIAMAVDPQGRADVYNFFVYSFKNPLVVVVYVAAMVALCAHLAHAMSSMFKTLGIAEGRFRAPLEMVGPAFAALCLIGFLIPPLACAVGVIEPAFDGAEAEGAEVAAGEAAADHGESH